jgi:hypothetical protein
MASGFRESSGAAHGPLPAGVLPELLPCFLPCLLQSLTQLPIHLQVPIGSFPMSFDVYRNRQLEESYWLPSPSWLPIKLGVDLGFGIKGSLLLNLLLGGELCTPSVPK